MYFYLSGKGLSYWARIIGSISFAFSGYLLSVLHMPTSLASVIWLPLILLYWDRIIIKSEILNPCLPAGTAKSEQCTYNNVRSTQCWDLGFGNWDLIILIILLAVMFLGGEPTIFYGTILFLIFYAAFYPGFFRSFFVLFFAALASLCLIAVQLFPFLELSMNSVRAGGLSFYEATQWSMSPQRILEFIIPFFYHMTSLPWASYLWLKSLYMGVFPLVLAGGAFFMRDKKMKKILFLGLIISLVLAMGKYTPIYALLFNFLPGFSQIRFPAKFLFLTAFLLSVLSAYGYDALREYNNGKIKWPFILGAVLILFSLAGYLMPEWFYSFFRPLFGEEIKAGFEPQMHAMNMRNIVNFGISGVFLVLSGMVLYFSGKSAKKENIMIFFLPLILFDIYLANFNLNLSINASDFQVESPNINLLIKDKEKFRVMSSPELIKRSVYETSDESIDYRSALISIRDRVSTNQNMLYKIESAQAYESIHGADQEALLCRIYAINDYRGLLILDMLNVKYLLTPYPFFAPGYRLLSRRDELIREGSIFLYQNMNVMPRQYEVSSFKIFKDRKMLFDYMFSDKFNFRKAILLEEEPEKCDRFLFVSESFYPGWRAYVDGKEAKIYRANYMFRAVPLSAGPHDVKFIYDPVSVKAGALISCATLLGLITFALYPKMKENKRS